MIVELSPKKHDFIHTLHFATSPVWHLKNQFVVQTNQQNKFVVQMSQLTATLRAACQLLKLFMQMN